MNWYKRASLNPSQIDTRTKYGQDDANKSVLDIIELNVGDNIESTAGMSNGPDKIYTVQKINMPPAGYTVETRKPFAQMNPKERQEYQARPAYYSVDLLANETGRLMPNTTLYNPQKQNQPAWKKV